MVNCDGVKGRRGKPFFSALPIFLVSAAIWTSATADAQTLYSFENDLEGFFLPDDGGGISLGQSTIGATDGLQSMAVEVDSPWTWDAKVEVYPPATGLAVYNAFNAVSADLSSYTIDMDVTFSSESWANVTFPDDQQWFHINLAVNSDMGWQQIGGVLQLPSGVVGTYLASVPMTDLPVAPDSSWYELNIGSNSRHSLGPSGEGVTYYVDNIRFARIPVFTEDLLFSWETPDDTGTPEDERFEGWVSEWDGGGGHNHSITTTGATDGDHALQFDRTGTMDFIWGSKVELSGGEGTPEQDTIDDLVQRIESADRLAFDITLTDQFPASPTWLNFAVSISDNAGGWFQSPQFNVDPQVTEETTFTFDMGLDQFLDGDDSLADVGLAEGTDFLRFAISSNTDDSEDYGIYQIDNFRLLTEVVPLTADFNEDGLVDGNDFLIWQAGFPTESGAELSDGDADADGDVDGNDFLLWQSNFDAGGGLAAGAVPEPSSAFLAASVGWLVLLIRRPCRRG